MRYLLIILPLSCFAETLNCTYNYTKDIQLKYDKAQSLMLEGLKNSVKTKIYVKNPNTPDSSEDYVSMQDSQGNTMTYSLECNGAE